MTGTISRDELHNKIQRGEQFYLFEVLPRMYWRKHHLPGARSLPLDELEATIASIVPDMRAEIVVYCWNFT
jgi:rhodanese-related sulfurtransferase